MIDEFERGAKKEYRSLVSKFKVRRNRKYREYKLTIQLEEYESRKVHIRFTGEIEQIPQVTVDGPNDSPHRYEGRYLCMWYPKDPDTEKWTFSDGLLALLVMIEAHLFREAWWRETGEWLGPEVKH